MNDLKARLEAGECLPGVWISSDSVVAIEVAGLSGLAWIVLDLEHGNFEPSLALSAIRAADAAGIALIVRVPDQAAAPIGRYLDWGVAGIMAPSVHSAAAAKAVVAAMRFPPNGQRGMSRSVRATGFGATHGQQDPVEPLCIVQIESAAAVEQVREIAAVDGVHVLFLGHTDLSQELGCLGNLQDPRILAAEERLLAACDTARKQAGMAVAPSAAGVAARRGFRFVTIGSDVTLLRAGLEQAQKTFQSSLKS